MGSGGGGGVGGPTKLLKSPKRKLCQAFLYIYLVYMYSVGFLALSGMSFKSNVNVSIRINIIPIITIIYPAISSL